VDDDTTDVLAELYGLITNVYKARDIRTAEAAKVIENIQRDLNIALMNELAIIFHKMGLHKLFCKQKPLLKNAYAIFCFAKRNISLVKLSF
jgi:UDP-N-acetyl-D-mannosaminuronate dehydrogenase